MTSNKDLAQTGELLALRQETSPPIDRQRWSIAATYLPTFVIRWLNRGSMPEQ